MRLTAAVCVLSLAVGGPAWGSGGERGSSSKPAAEAETRDGTGSGRRPNVIFILADDQRFDELGCTGHPWLETPNIDRLARTGLLFENSFVSSASCMPNRASLLTGQWERRHTIGWNSGTALSAGQWADTLPMVLRRNGYVTAAIGKNHVPGLRPWDFDGYYGNWLGHLGFYPKAAHPIFRNARVDTQPEILGAGAENFLEADPGFVERAGEGAELFLRRRDPTRPFFLSISFNVPHSAGTGTMRQRPTDDPLYRTAYCDLESRMPLPPGYVAEADLRSPKLPPAIYSGRQIATYDYRRTPESLRAQRVRICQTVAGIDRVVGRIVEQLDRLGLADDTIIVYTSDNGILHGEHGYGGKMLLYDPSIRVPLVIHDPRIAAKHRGRRVRELVVSPDIAPTLLDLCGVAQPAVMQGRSLRPLLEAEPVVWRTDFFCESLMLLQEYPLIQSVRTGDWKYLRYWPNRSPPEDYRELLNLGLDGEPPAYEELFHLAADPLEQRNLASDPSAAPHLARMQARCMALLRDTRGDSEALPSVPVAAWSDETPVAWRAVMPLLSRKAAAKRE